MAEILVEDHGPVRRLILSRPEKRNALAHQMIALLLAELERAGRDEAVCALILAGAGAGFSAGADLTEARAATDEAGVRAHADLMGRLLVAPSKLPKPIVAEVHGFALGAGFGLALACDIVVCAKDAVLAFPETPHGMVPALVAPPLARRVGYGAAFELLATAEPVPVERAAALGLVRSSAPENLAAEAQALATRLAAAPAHAIDALKALLQDISGKDMSSAMAIAGEANVAGKLRRLRERP
jgi:enoyl-CoA hydratase/carnithine racemase